MVSSSRPNRSLALSVPPTVHGRTLQQAHLGGGKEMPGLPRHDPAIVCLVQHQRQPADLQFRTRADQQIGAPHTGDQTGTCLDVMWIL